MTDMIRRHRSAGWRDGVFRIVAFVLAVALLALAWNLARPAVAHELARMQLGNWRAVPLIERAIGDRNPELALRSWSERWLPLSSAQFTTTFRGRRAGAAILVRLDTGDGSWRDEWAIVDEQLSPIGRTSVPLWYSNEPPPDDRDGDGLIEVSTRVYIGQRWPSQAVVQVGRDHSALLAVIVEPTRGAPSWMAAWTNSDHDETHELEVFVLRTTGGTSTWVSELRLGWSGPGRMVVERPSTSGFEVWLPPEGETVTFEPSEPVADVVKRVLGK